MDDNAFISKQEKPNFEMKFIKLAPEVWKALSELERTGWIKRGVKNPETVAEHTVALRNLASELFYKLPEFSKQDKEDLLDMLEIHDWPESKKEVGDQVIYTYNEEEKKNLKEIKFKAEYDAMKEICDNMSSNGDRVFALWIRFEKKEDPVSIFANQVDKYQAMEKAFEYQKKGENVSAQEFIDYQGNLVVHPVLASQLIELQKKVSDFNTRT